MATWTVGSGKTYSTIQAALDALYTSVTTNAFTETQTIEVYAGTYVESVTPNTGLNPTAAYRLVITVAAGNSPIVDGASGQTTGIRINGIDYVTVNGIEVKNNTIRGIYVYTASQYAIITNNTVHHNDYNIFVTGSSNNAIVSGNTSYLATTVCLQVDGDNHTVFSNTAYSATYVGISITGDATSIYNNISYSNGQHGISLSHCNGLLCYGNELYLNTQNGINMNQCNDFRVYNNFIHNNTLVGISQYNSNTNPGTYYYIYNNLTYANAGGGISIYNSDGVEYYNNTSYNIAATYNILVEICANVLVKNNIFYCGNSKRIYGIAATATSGLVLDYNVCYITGGAKTGVYSGVDYATLALWKAGTSKDASSIDSDPLFDNLGGTTAADYKVGSGSPAREMGLDLSTIFTVDYFGTTRPQSSAWDVGFYEYPFTPSPVTPTKNMNYVVVTNTGTALAKPTGDTIEINGYSLKSNGATGSFDVLDDTDLVFSIPKTTAAGSLTVNRFPVGIKFKGSVVITGSVTNLAAITLFYIQD